jgi:hypothetical protein
MLQRAGARVPLVAISDNRFIFVGGGAEVEFAKDPQGRVTQLIFTAVEGQIRATRSVN